MEVADLRMSNSRDSAAKSRGRWWRGPLFSTFRYISIDAPISAAHDEIPSRRFEPLLCELC